MVQTQDPGHAFPGLSTQVALGRPSLLVILRAKLAIVNVEVQYKPMGFVPPQEARTSQSVHIVTLRLVSQLRPHTGVRCLTCPSPLNQTTRHRVPKHRSSAISVKQHCH